MSRKKDKPRANILMAIANAPISIMGFRPNRSTVKMATTVNNILTNPIIMVCSKEESFPAPMLLNISPA